MLAVGRLQALLPLRKPAARLLTLLPLCTSPLAQVWCSLSFLTEIRHRVLLLRLLHLTGSVPSCQRAISCAHSAATAGRRLTQQQARLAEEAHAKLAAMAV